jgi:site-specific DNA-methyltransferase (cytosine-N4-specific)
MQLTLRLKPYIQPFERVLAFAEVERLTGSLPRHVSGDGEADNLYHIEFQRPDLLVSHLAYWESVTDGQTRLTTQVLREATVNLVRNGIDLHELRSLLPLRDDALPPNRRCLRYGTHGLHEYRGKFFPQLVRSLLNHANVRDGATVLDPMAGSGTTIVEAVLAGCNARGLDLNPLSAFISRTKCSSLFLKPKDLETAYLRIRDDVLAAYPRSASGSHFASLPADDQQYLSRWFSPQALADLDSIFAAIRCSTKAATRDFFTLVLSNILRRVSWQKNDDLRVRREIATDAEIDPIREFLEEAGRSVRLVLAFLYQNHKPAGVYRVDVGDARLASQIWSDLRGRSDVVITSPPYATALPYLDTDRLSLSYLGLLTRPQHRRRDEHMIGNREITERQRRAYLDLMKSHSDAMPRPVLALIHKIDRLNRDSDVGFRRRNVAALLAKYFSDMNQVLREIKRLLKVQGSAYVVVGSNHTIAGGEKVEIDTPRLTAAVARNVGFELTSTIPMEMLISRDIFRNNTGSAEVILCLRRRRR